MPNLLTNHRKPAIPPITAPLGNHQYWLVESHLGAVSFLADEPDDDSLYCEQCGDMDTVYGLVDLANPDDVIHLARYVAAHTDDWPMPWEDTLQQYLSNYDWTLRMLWNACAQTDSDVHWNMPAFQWMFRQQLTAFWAINGLAPFNRQRCVNYYTQLTKQEYANEHDNSHDPVLIAQRFINRDWMIMNTDPYGEGTHHPYGPMMPAPYVGCLLEARMRIIPQYRDQWLTMIEQYEPLQWVEPVEYQPDQWHNPTQQTTPHEHIVYALRPYNTRMRMAFLQYDPNLEETSSRPFKRIRNNRKRHSGIDLMRLLTAA